MTSPPTIANKVDDQWVRHDTGDVAQKEGALNESRRLSWWLLLAMHCYNSWMLGQGMFPFDVRERTRPN